VLPRFAAQYPELTLNVSFSDRMIDLIDEGIDATVRVGMGSDSRLIMRNLGVMRFVTCASPQYLTSNGMPKTPEDLAAHRCVNFIYPQTRREFDWKFEQKDKPLNLSLKSHLQFDDAEVVLNGYGLKATNRNLGVVKKQLHGFGLQSLANKEEAP
jgi:LysR family transcriptional regulator, regulator for bpeEF and oprC